MFSQNFCKTKNQAKYIISLLLRNCFISIANKNIRKNAILVLGFLCFFGFEAQLIGLSKSNPPPIEMGLFNPHCGQFEIRLRPSADVVSNITNIQFTLKWPENTTNLQNFESNYKLSQQGAVQTSGGFNYAVFVSVPVTVGLPIDWQAGQEHVILSFVHDQSGSSTETFEMFIADDQWAINNNGLHYLELLGLDATGSIYHQPTNVFGGACNFAFIKVILQGAYHEDSGEMLTSINAAGNLPTGQTYNAQPWEYSGNESLSILPDSIVDWVIVELRDPVNPSILVGRRAGLLSKNGVIMDVNLLSGLNFPNPPGYYHLVVKHRNHIPVMTGVPVSFPNNINHYDFTEIVTSQPYKHLDPLPAVLEVGAEGSNKYGMIAGDVNADGVLKYTGASNDRDSILEKIEQETGSPDLTGTATGYFIQDVNLDNTIRYIGADNDRDIILNNLIRLTGSDLINTIYITVVPDIE